jgi:hypothetical protein
MTSIFLKMKDGHKKNVTKTITSKNNNIFLKWKTTSIFLKMEDDLNIFENGRRPKFFVKGRRPHFFNKLNTTSKK